MILEQKNTNLETVHYQEGMLWATLRSRKFRIRKQYTIEEWSDPTKVIGFIRLYYLGIDIHFRQVNSDFILPQELGIYTNTESDQAWI